MSRKALYTKKQITSETIIKFGRYRGYKAKDVPVKYWQWLLDNEMPMCYQGVKTLLQNNFKTN